jgi:hypothetical protein
MYGAFATTNQQQSLHRRGLSTGYSTRPQDLRPVSPDGKVSMTSNGQLGQQHMRAAQMPASTRPGPSNAFFSDSDSTGFLQTHNHNLININEENEMSEGRFQASDKTDGNQDVSSSSMDQVRAKAGEPNGAAAMLLEFMEKMNGFSNNDVKQALQGMFQNERRDWLS